MLKMNVDVGRALVSDYPPKQIMDKIDKIEKKIDRIEEKLDKHIDFIMNVYGPLSKPIERVKRWFE